MKSPKRLLFAFIIPFFLSNHVSGSEERGAKYYLQEGNQYLLSGKYNDAILSYDAAIQYDPNDYISYYKRATAYLSLGKTNPAIEDFSKILTLKPGFKQALLERAKLYLADGEYKLAKQDLEGVNQDDSTKLLLSSISEAEKSSQIAQESFSHKQYDQCIQHATRVIQISPQRSQWRTLRAQCHFGKGEIEEAVNDLTRVSYLNPSDQELILQLAKLNFYSLYEPDRATAQVKQCLHYDPEHKPCKSLFRQIKRFQKDLQKVVDAKQQQRFATAFNTLVGTSTKKGLVSELDEPFKALKAEMKIENLPKKLHLTCYELACQLSAEQKDSERIDTWCSAILKINPDHPDALAHLGELKLNNNDFEGAVHDLEKAYEASGQQDHRIRQLLNKAQQLLRQSKKRDYYKILDVSRDADPRTIKKAYRKKAYEWHPDKYSGNLDKDQVESKMAEINQAYEVLSDPAKREQFDNGFDPFDPEAGAHQQNPFNFHGGDNPFAHFAGGGHGFPFGSTGGFTFHF
ncbi:protein prenylyltransferase [Rhizopus microsporus ATCC 52813]|uniref:Protein prenylyltransferase n=1 Tax=Rhizopus microsporus ATCC 52813 TaxID=1340429 RepID=A0A2G4SU31_RHIZD|nr:protein prenylyltransferase [Rhizopus microsporus ATCC 52813]PHZ12279.1 protein prenylyltransferase [Rhizopus microsporus ATCC 52813]